MIYPNLNTSTMKELRVFYNLHVEPEAEVKKFKNKEAAQLAVQALIAELEGNADEDTAEVLEETKKSSIAEQLTAANKEPSKKKDSTKNEGVWNNVQILFDQGLGNKEVHAQICEMYGNSNTTYACVAWYRNKYNKTSTKLQAEKTEAIKKMLDFAVKHDFSELSELAELCGIDMKDVSAYLEAKDEEVAEAE